METNGQREGEYPGTGEVVDGTIGGWGWGHHQGSGRRAVLLNCRLEYSMFSPSLPLPTYLPYSISYFFLLLSFFFACLCICLCRCASLPLFRGSPRHAVHTLPQPRMAEGACGTPQPHHKHVARPAPSPHPVIHIP